MRIWPQVVYNILWLHLHSVDLLALCNTTILLLWQRKTRERKTILDLKILKSKYVILLKLKGGGGNSNPVTSSCGRPWSEQFSCYGSKVAAARGHEIIYFGGTRSLWAHGSSVYGNIKWFTLVPTTWPV